MQFLILHKVRGEPAFDIAEPCQIGDEEGWVLCTCGHRAYPYWNRSLDDVLRPSDMDNVPPMPDNWPEHYAQHPQPKLKINVLELVSKMIPRLPRRI